MAWVIVAVVIWTLAKPGLLRGDPTGTPGRDGEQECYEDLLFLGSSPVLLRFHLRVDGQPWSLTRDRLAADQFQRLDRNRDGFLEPEQLEDLPWAGGAAVDFSAWDVTPADDRFSRQEFLKLFNSAGMPSFLLAEGPARATRRIHIFSHLDTDQDRRLTSDELARARHQLSRLDYDDDETVSTPELAPFVNPLIPQVNSSGEKPLGTEAPFVAVSSFATPADLARLMLKRYASPSPAPDSDTASDPDKEAPEACDIDGLGSAADQAAAFDSDGDGRLNLLEMSQFLQACEPDIELQVELPCSRPGRATLTVLEDRSGPRRTASRRPSSRASLVADQAELDVRAQGSLTQQRDNRAFYLLQFRIADQDKNMYLESGEFPQVGLNMDFDTVDSNGDGRVYREELVECLDRDAFESKVQVVLSVNADSPTLFEVMDVDFDQRLVAREFAEFPRRIGRWDSNRDGALDASELAQRYRLVFTMGKPRVFQQQMRSRSSGTLPTPRATPSRDAPAWFRKMDRNQDGDLSWREFLGPREIFDRLDADRDGLVTVEEWESSNAEGAGQDPP